MVQAAWAERHLFVDRGYKRLFGEWVRTVPGWTVQVMQRLDDNFRGIWWPEGRAIPEALGRKTRGHRGFVVIPRRWVVERTLAWLSFNRRLNRDYELPPETSETLVHTAMIRMVKRMAS